MKDNIYYHLDYYCVVTMLLTVEETSSEQSRGEGWVWGVEAGNFLVGW